MSTGTDVIQGQSAPSLATCLSENHLYHLGKGATPIPAIERRLHALLLFHPNGIAIPDSFVFSEAIRGLVQKNTWLFPAMQRGLLTVLTRNPAVRSFLDLREILKPLKLGTAEREEMEGVAKQLEGFSNDVSWQPWPDNMGKNYKQLVWNTLQVHEDALRERLHGASSAAPLIEALPRFKSILESAAKATKEKTGIADDLQHSEIIRATTYDFFKRQDVTATWQLLTIARDSGDKSVVAQLEAFLPLVACLYDKNFSAQNRLSVERIPYKPWMTDLVEQKDLLNSNANKDDVGTILKVNLPSMEVIRQLQPAQFATLVEARQYYNKAYSEFLKPGSEFVRLLRRDRLRDALIDYSKLICEAAAPARPDEYIVRIISESIGSLRRDGSTWAARRLMESGPSLGSPTILLKPFMPYVADLVEFYAPPRGPEIEFSVSGRVNIVHD